ncbi:MAG TPA: hypothetical protein VFI27_22450 [candidate division Zixibacteria bacterium]|nr:hypothetical protein [candidate division Zixibacteria bacterium]
MTRNLTTKAMYAIHPLEIIRIVKAAGCAAHFRGSCQKLFMHACAEPQHDIAYKGAIDLPQGKRKELEWIATSA